MIDEHVYKGMLLLEEHCTTLALGAGVLVAMWLFKKLFLGPKIPTIEVELKGPAETQSGPLPGEVFPQMELKDPARPGFIQCYEPFSMKKLGEVVAMDEAQVFDVVNKARAAQVEWCKTSFAERKRVLNTIQRYIVAHQDEICRVSARDSGKSKLDALLGEVITTCEKIRYVCAEGEDAIKPQSRKTSILTLAKDAFVEYHPLGVLGVIAPWNYPFHNLLNHIVSGIFTGNAVVCKVSEYTSYSSGYFMRIVHAALRACGHSPELVAVVTGFAEAGVALIDSGVDKVIFTGSPAVGKRVMERASQSLTPVVLELGGKDPFVICEDADLTPACQFAMRGVYQNCGQNCCGIERIYCYEQVLDKFLARIVPQVQALRQGCPLDEGIDCGAMVMPAQLDIVQELIDDAVNKGATIAAGGHRNAALPGGLYFEPTVLTGVTHDMRIAREEVFGPVMTIITVKNDTHMLRLVNDSDFGLGSSIFTADQSRAERLGRKVRAGMTCLNDFGVNYLVQSLPFGGVKHSGFDRFAGPEGLRACCLQKSVVKDKFSFMRASIPPALCYPIKPASMDFGQGLISMIYAEGLLAKAKAVLKLIKASF